MSYNLMTDDQKNLIRWLVKEVRDGALSEEFLVDWTIEQGQGGMICRYKEGRVSRYPGKQPIITKGAVDTLVDAKLLVCTSRYQTTYSRAGSRVKQRESETSRRCTIMPQAYEAVDSDFVLPDIPSTTSLSSPRQYSEYVDSDRIEELRVISSQKFDLTKLIELCEELNRCYAAECFLAVAMLIRAILDHVPPIFGFNRFSKVANNYGGAKSFKEAMQHLENSSRKIADLHLHRQIRKKETLPNKTQVNFSSDLDLLLAEIVSTLA